LRFTLEATDLPSTMPRDPYILQARWGRAAMASFFVVSATISTVSNEQSWSRIAIGDASPLDWLYAVSVIAGVVSGFLFALGIATVAIANLWIAYCVFNAIMTYPFWAVAPAAVPDSVSGFLSQMAVAASLMLYITHKEATP
jgi:uncharacterized membrane protein YphA (DoxX/SURF4 family)